MATYLGTHGSRIQNYTTDPDNPNTGEVWYNDTDNVLKFQYASCNSQLVRGGYWWKFKYSSRANLARRWNVCYKQMHHAMGGDGPPPY